MRKPVFSSRRRESPSQPSWPLATSGGDGYALIEVVVAMVFTAITLGTLVSSLQQSQQTMKQEAVRTQALALCQDQLERSRYLWTIGALPDTVPAMSATMTDPNFVGSFAITPTSFTTPTGAIATLYRLEVEYAPCLNRLAEIAAGRPDNPVPMASGVSLFMLLASQTAP